MAVTYKDINLLTQKSSVAGTEKLPVSDTQYITPSQIAASVPVDASLSSSSTNAIQNKAVDAEFDKVVYIGNEGETIEDIPDAPDTSDCVHITGDESVGGDKTFTDNIAVVDASHILYSGASPSQGFTRGYATAGGDTNVLEFSGILEEPKAFIISPVGSITDVSYGTVIGIVGDSTGIHVVYTTGTQNNFSTSAIKGYSNGVFWVEFTTELFGDFNWQMVYYYGDGTLTFKTSQVQPGSGATTATFTGASLTELPSFYAIMLESQVNNEQYRRVAYYTNEGGGASATPMGVSFYSSQIHNTTSSFSVSYNNGLYINSGGTNAGGYFHNPGTYTLYYLMASDVAGGGGGGFQSLGDELDDIRDTIGDIATILASI